MFQKKNRGVLWGFVCLYRMVTVMVTVLVLDPTVGDPLKVTVYVPGVVPLNTSWDCTDGVVLVSVALPGPKGQLTPVVDPDGQLAEK